MRFRSFPMSSSSPGDGGGVTDRCVPTSPRLDVRSAENDVDDELQPTVCAARGDAYECSCIVCETVLLEPALRTDIGEVVCTGNCVAMLGRLLSTILSLSAPPAVTGCRLRGES